MLYRADKESDTVNYNTRTEMKLSGNGLRELWSDEEKMSSIKTLQFTQMMQTSICDTGNFFYMEGQ